MNLQVYGIYCGALVQKTRTLNIFYGLSDSFKIYETWDVLACVSDVHVMTLRKRIWLVIEAIAELKLVISKQFFQFFMSKLSALTIIVHLLI